MSRFCNDWYLLVDTNEQSHKNRILYNLLNSFQFMQLAKTLKVVQLVVVVYH